MMNIQEEINKMSKKESKQISESKPISESRFILKKRTRI